MYQICSEKFLNLITLQYVILFRPAPHQNYINSLKLEMVEIDRYVSITLTDNTSGTFSTYLFPFVFGKQKLFSQLYDIMPSCRCCYCMHLSFLQMPLAWKG